jgi:tetratricopeptide (TPR) repeat protein
VPPDSVRFSSGSWLPSGLHLLATMNCPACASPETVFKTRLSKWLCTDCWHQYGEAPSHATGAAYRCANPKRIFFSYGHDGNSELVGRIQKDLEARGHSVWIDHERIEAWDDWKGKITRGIAAQQMAVAFLSVHSTRDPGVCRNEIALALQHFGTVYPILLEALPLESIPSSIQRLHWPDLSRWRMMKELGEAEFERWYREQFGEIAGKLEGKLAPFASEAEALRRVLRPFNFDARFAQHLEGFVGREWVFDSFERWYKHQPESRVFWLKAGPGFGKTAWAVSLADRCRSAVVATWLCDHQSLELREPARAVCGLAFQLALRLEDYRARLLNALEIAGGSLESQLEEAAAKLEGRHAHELFELLILQPLSGLIDIDRSDKQVILVDALDESVDETGSTALAALIAGRFMELPKWVCFVVTSRADPSVTAHLQRFKPFEITADDNRNAADLERYCRHALDGFSRTAEMDSAQTDALCGELLEKSDGMVLYLRMVVEGLRSGALAPSDLGRLKSGLGGINGWYHLEFEKRFGAVFQVGVLPLLRLVVAAPGPLPLDLAARVLGCGLEDARRMCGMLGVFLVEGTAGISLFHKTLGEWLQSADSGVFFTDAAQGRVALGDFLWRCFALRGQGLGVDAGTPEFETHVLDWLFQLLPSLAQWNDWVALGGFADYLREKVRYEAAEVLYRRALAGFEKTRGQHDIAAVRLNGKLGEVLRLQGDYGEARDFFQTAYQLLALSSEAEKGEADLCLNLLGKVIGMCGDNEDGKALCRQAVEGMEKALGPDNPSVMQGLHDLGIMLRKTGDHAEAELVGTKAFRGRERVLGPKHVDTLKSLHNLANLHRDKRDFDLAANLYRRALDRRSEALGPQHPDTLRSLNNLGELLRLKRLYSEAESLLGKAVSGRTQVLGREHPDTLWSTKMLGLCLMDQGRLSEAEVLLRSAAEGLCRRLGPQHPDSVGALEALEQLQAKVRSSRAC